MLRLTDIISLLKQEQLLKEITYQNKWYYQLPELKKEMVVDYLTYDSRDIKPNSLFFCKGLHFNEQFLNDAVASGVQLYVSEEIYEDTPDDVLGLIVTDIRKALAVVSMHFFGLPQNELKIIAFTGTKGKTSSAYFCYNVLKKATNNKVALFSTIKTDVGNGEEFKSKLTTEESYMLFKYMRQAVDNKMTHLVMEVSSQAYKQERVYGLTFDVGVFLNISPDHIGPIEHPTFDDYLYCKRQLAKHSKQFVLNLDSDYSDFLQEEIKELPTTLWTYSSEDKQADVTFNTLSTNTFEVKSDVLKVSGNYEMSVEGLFNQGNAVSGLMAAALVVENPTGFKEAIKETVIPGRMEKLFTNKGIPVYVDFAHNTLSLESLFAHLRQTYPDKKIKIIIGATGDKGVERRIDIGRALSRYADAAVLTNDDPGSEDPMSIAQAIIDNMNPPIPCEVIINRKDAILKTLANAQLDEVVVVSGKGDDQYQVINSQVVDYDGDRQVVEEFIKNETK